MSSAGRKTAPGIKIPLIIYNQNPNGTYTNRVPGCKEEQLAGRHNRSSQRNAGCTKDSFEKRDQPNLNTCKTGDCGPRIVHILARKTDPKYSAVLS